MREIDSSVYTVKTTEFDNKTKKDLYLLFNDIVKEIRNGTAKDIVKIFNLCHYLPERQKLLIQQNLLLMINRGGI